MTFESSKETTVLERPATSGESETPFSTATPTPARHWLERFSDHLEAYENDNGLLFLLMLLSLLLYAFISFAFALRPLWHDEIYTYYIAKSPSLTRFIDAVSRVDLQPPLQYALTRLSLTVFGDSALASRIPDMAGFLLGSICLYHIVRKKMGRFYGLAAMLVLWLSPFLQYAGEARPYALVLGFFCLAMLGWQAAIEYRRRRLGLLAIAFGTWGMLMSHCFSPVFVAVLAMAELVRSVGDRRLDWPVWLSLITPAPFVLVYVPLFRHFEKWTIFPPEFQASPLKMIGFYSDLLSAMSVVLLIALVAALIGRRSATAAKRTSSPIFYKHEVALVLGLLSLPIIINLFLMRTGAAFWPRYCILTAIGVSLLFVYVLAKLTGGSRAAAGIAASCIFLGIAGGFMLQAIRPAPRAKIKTLLLKDLNPRVPLVAASGLTFLEMNKRENPSLSSHIFYLTDRQAAIRYAHATIFEGTGALRDYFPIHGTVEPYYKFIRQNRQFLVLGTPDYPEDWLIAKLIADGAELDFKGELRSHYKDRMIFDVKMPAALQQ